MIEFSVFENNQIEVRAIVPYYPRALGQPRQRIGGHAPQPVGEKPGNFSCREKQPRCGLWSDQLSLGINRKRMSVLAMVPCNVITAMSTTCSDLGRS